MTDHRRADTEALERTLANAGSRARGTASAGSASAAAGAAGRLSSRLAAEGLADVSYAPADSPFGPLLLAATRRGLVRLAFPEEDIDSVLERLASKISPPVSYTHLTLPTTPYV